MTVLDAINAVVGYLSRQPIVFSLHRAWEETEGEAHFRVAVHQHQPENTLRTFDVAPADDVADCWNVVEVQA